MAHIHNFPELNLSPSRLRLNYTLNSKSTKSTIARKSINAIETPPESLTKRILLSPKKIQTDPHTSIMSKLQNELDLEEISLKSNELKNYPEKKRKKAEQKVYSQYMDSIIKRILKTNESLGKLLERGWKGYQDSLLPIKTDTNSDLIVRVNSESASQSTQVSEEMIFSREEKNIDSYIEYLHSALRGINSMNMSKIISKLSELNYSLRPIDVPSASETPEIEEINFSETMKNIHSKFRSKSLKRPKKIEIPEKIPTKDQLSQTLLKMDDLKAMDAYRAIIKVKEDLIGELNLKLRRKDESEEVIKAKNKEIDELKRDFLRLKLDCPNCVIKDKKLKKREFEIKRLKLSSTDNFGVEFEESKKKLEENSQTIILNQNTINQLNSNLKDLESKYHEALLLRDKLQSQLKREETLRKSIEYQLQKQIDSNTALKLINDPFKSPKNTEDLLEIPESNLSKNQTFTSFKKKSSSASPDKKRTIIRADIEAPEVKKSKKETLMSLLNMTKDEYLALSKKARLDIYVCLLQHTKRCGANCSHLQRAMMIRYKNRGPLFPVKKYNIE